MVSNNCGSLRASRTHGPSRGEKPAAPLLLELNEPADDEPADFGHHWMDIRCQGEMEKWTQRTPISHAEIVRKCQLLMSELMPAAFLGRAR